MPIPRYISRDGTPMDICKACPVCGYAVADCVVVAEWVDCPLCKRGGKVSKLEDRVTYYPTVNLRGKKARA